MGNYHKMLKYYKEKGLFSETKMWESIECLDDILEEMKEKNPDMFWDFMRNQHEIFCGPHFDEKFAKWQVEQMYHKDDDGKEYRGQHWSIAEAEEVYSKNKSKLPSGTTVFDVYVAINIFWHDLFDGYKHFVSENGLPEKLSSELTIKSAIKFFFMDDDAIDGKVWIYSEALNNEK